MEYPAPIEKFRQADHPIDPLFLKRWSPRSMNGQPLKAETLKPLFEAARWAPSNGNTQPWRFVYALRGDDSFRRLYEALNPGNQPWCAKAGALVLICSLMESEKRGQIRPLDWHSFDAGAAWMSLALQGSLLNLVVHAMAGFDPAKARGAVFLPPACKPEAMVAIGHPAPAEDLPENFREREKPNSRLRVAEIAFPDRWPE